MQRSLKWQNDLWAHLCVRVDGCDVIAKERRGKKESNDEEGGRKEDARASILGATRKKVKKHSSRSSQYGTAP